MGIHDGSVLDVLYDSLNNARQPFCMKEFLLSAVMKPIRSSYENSFLREPL